MTYNVCGGTLSLNQSILTTPICIFPHRIGSVLSKFSHKKTILFGCRPLDGVTRGVPPSDATVNIGRFMVVFLCMVV